jgi:hypothetical protein
MRSIRSARVAASIGATSLSFRITRSRSCSCTTTTSLTSVNSRLQKVIAKLAFLVEWWNYQRREGQKSILTQMHLLGDLYFGPIGNSIQTGIFSRFPVGSVTETAPSPRLGLRRI